MAGQRSVSVTDGSSRPAVSSLRRRTARRDSGLGWRGSSGSPSRVCCVTRIPLVGSDGEGDGDDAQAREVLRDVSGARGSIEPNVYRAIANHPEALRAMAEFGRVVYFDNALTPAQRELAYLTASVTNDCHY